MKLSLDLRHPQKISFGNKRHKNVRDNFDTIIKSSDAISVFLLLKCYIVRNITRLHDGAFAALHRVV